MAQLDEIKTALAALLPVRLFHEDGSTIFARREDGQGKLLIQTFEDMFKITALAPHREWIGEYERTGIWHVTPDEITDGTVRDGVDDLMWVSASEASCARLLGLLTGAARVEMREARA
jgi:hypothetical protein